MRVNCNISAIIANNQLSKSEDALSSAIERLSSGLRINKAEDDASGMAISKKMHAQIKAIERSANNTQDGVSVVQTAEGALSELENILQRMRELSVKAASETNSGEEKDAIQVEINQLTKEVDRISTSTEYNTMTLLDGTLQRRAYADKDNVSATISDTVTAGEYSIEVTKEATRPSVDLDLPANAPSAGYISINGVKVDIEAGESISSIESKIQEACERSNATMSKDNGTMTISGKMYGKNEQLKITFSSAEIAGIFGQTDTNIMVNGTDCEAALKKGFSSTATLTTEGANITVKDIGSFEMDIEVPGDTKYAECVIKATDIGIMRIQAGANEGQQLSIGIPEVSMHTLGLDNLNLRTENCAKDAMTRLDGAISKVSSIRSKLGAYQNRLETATGNLNEYNENITAALSRIEDCDMAAEMTEFTAQNVKTQAATSILAQANQRPETILQLLQ